MAIEVADATHLPRAIRPGAGGVAAVVVLEEPNRDTSVLRVLADVLPAVGGGSAPGRRQRQRNLRFPPAKTRIVPER